MCLYRTTLVHVCFEDFSLDPIVYRRLMAYAEVFIDLCEETITAVLEFSRIFVHLLNQYMVL